jgi:hypothetical protein
VAVRGDARRRASGRSERGSVRRSAPLIAKVVGRAAAGLAFLAVAVFLTIIVLMIVGGAGNGRDISDTPIGGAVLGLLLPVMAGSVIVAVLLALLNQIGILPWFDPRTARFIRPSGRADWAVKLGGLVAGLLLPLTALSLAGQIAILTSAGVDSDDWAVPLIATLIGGVAVTVTVAGVAGGIAVMGWFGAVAGLLLGAGLVGVIAGPFAGVPAATALGVVAIGLSVACYYAGGRMQGAIPHQFGSYAASGAFLLLGVAFFVVSALSHDLVFLIGGVAAVAATVGYVVGGLLGRARDSATA